MTTPIAVNFSPIPTDSVNAIEGGIAVFVTTDGRFDPVGRRINRITKGAIERLIASARFEKLAEGEALALNYPHGLVAETLVVVKLDRRAKPNLARKAGAAVAACCPKGPLTLVAGQQGNGVELALGCVLRSYGYTDQKSEVEPDDTRAVTCFVADPDQASAGYAARAAVADGVFFTRDLVNAPANVLTTTAFAEQLLALSDLGVEVEVLDEPELTKLGMGALLGVGQGSDAPSKVVVMQWKGGDQEQPFALVGKGVVFDTGGISLKPAGGMEDMTMDMGGAGVVAGAMKALALRKAKANVVGLVGLVENMPGPNAQRPGDIVTSMKGDTIEVINTDAEGRLVLADVMWYAQDRFAPSGMIDLATLTGAVIIALGHENTGVFSNDDKLCRALLGAADTEGEGAWRLPLGAAYDKQLKSLKADMKNVGGRPAGSITAAQFLQRFVKDGTPWIHLDIAGTAQTSSATELAPKGATGWGVRTLDRLMFNLFEKE
ncbi:MAG: leucyl aminopeptidase [Brevirhabdus sp.]